MFLSLYLLKFEVCSRYLINSFDINTLEILLWDSYCSTSGNKIFFFSTFSESEISIVVQEMTDLCSHFEVPHKVFTQKLILYYFLIKLFHEEITNVFFQILLLSSYFGFCDTDIWLGFFEFNSSGKKKVYFFPVLFWYLSALISCPPSCLSAKHENSFMFWFVSFQSLGNIFNLFYSHFLLKFY